MNQILRMGRGPGNWTEVRQTKVLGPVNTCFAPTTMTEFQPEQGTRRAAEYALQAASNDVAGEIPSHPSGLRTKKRGCSVAKLGHRRVMPCALRLALTLFRAATWARNKC
jgi:hypothetical protein